MYVYQADILCNDCGERVRKQLTERSEAPADPNAENTYDSDQFPKGPYDDSEESDTPVHCSSCHVFLKNQLTQAGYAYVAETLGDTDSGDLSEIEQTWADFYGFYLVADEARHWVSDEQKGFERYAKTL